MGPAAVVARWLIASSCLWWGSLGEVVATDAGEQGEWRELKHAQGIRVLVQEREGDILKVKARTEIDAPLARVKAVIDDSTSHPQWVPYLVETRILTRESQGQALLYSRFDAPWPARDRDFVYQSRLTHLPDGGFSYRLGSRESESMPPQAHYVRARLIEGAYRLFPLEEDKTQVEFMFHADPRGHLPLWIVNIVQRRFPFDALLGLRRVLEQNDSAASAQTEE